MDSLKDRTGVEIILFVCRGTTDLPLCSVSYATKGVEHLIDSVLKINNADFISKMEGFAIQGIRSKFVVFCVYSYKYSSCIQVLQTTTSSMCPTFVLRFKINYVCIFFKNWVYYNSQKILGDITEALLAKCHYPLIQPLSGYVCICVFPIVLSVQNMELAPL